MSNPRTSSNRSAAKIAAVAWREFKHTALTKAFLFGAIVLPIIIWGIIAISPLFLSREPPPLTGSVAIVDPSGLVSAEAERQFRAAAEPKPSGIGSVVEAVGAAQSGDAAALEKAIDTSGPVNISVIAVTEPAEAEALRERVRKNDLLAVAVVDPALLTATPGDTKLELLVQTTSSPKHTSLYERILRDATVKARVAATGGDYEALTGMLKRPAIETERVARGGGTAKERGDARMLVPMAFMFLLWIAVFSSGQYLLTTTIEEKSNKVMEVLLSAVSPMQLLAGKIIGQALVSLVIILIYGGVAIWGLAFLSMLDLIQPLMLVYLAVFYVMAYFMVATMMAAVGSAVSDLREAQALVTPAMLVLIVPMILWLPITDSPNGALATATSFIPPAIPFVMIMRLTGTETIPFWQTALSIVVGFAAMFGMLWAAARIFRVGVLMQGKPPSFFELMKWAVRP